MSPQKGCRFYMVYQFFWEELGLRGANKEVYAVIFGLCSSFQGVAKVSIGDICALTGLSKLSVMKAQEYLISRGLIKRLPKKHHNEKSSYMLKGHKNNTTCRYKKYTSGGIENIPHIDNRYDNYIKPKKRKNGNSQIALEAPDTFKGRTTL